MIALYFFSLYLSLPIADSDFLAEYQPEQEVNPDAWLAFQALIAMGED